MKFRWSVAADQSALAAQLSASLKRAPLLAQCLLNRGFSEPDSIAAFLEPRLKRLADPFLLPNMAAAVERLFLALSRREKVVLFGDYDVDGVTSTALLLQVMRPLGWTVECYLPHRIEEGYGLSQEGVENCLKRFPASLLVAVDCGSTTIHSVAWLNERGVDVIVLDHHQVSSPAPAVVALVNPQATNGAAGESAGAFTELCSAGLAFKLAHALLKRGRVTGLPGAADFDLRPLLDLVALGTVADIVPLRGENRILVAAGLERLNSTKRPGLVALKEVAQCSGPVGPFEVGFQLGPRLNAAGRLETAEAALQLLMTEDLGEARTLARKLDVCNRERRELERRIAEEALAAVQARFKPEEHFVIVEGQEPWHVGVVGIVASRILQQFYRPTIIVGGDGVEWRGSGRSIAGFDLAAALRECSDLLVRHGGHAMAAGLTIAPGNLEPFRERLNELARRSLKPEQLLPELALDAEVSLAELTVGSLSELDLLRPMGLGNPAVQLCVRNVAHQRPWQRVGAAKQHLKMWITDGRATHEAVWWGAAKESVPAGPFDLAFTPSINEFQGRRSVQLKVLDWRNTGI